MPGLYLWNVGQGQWLTWVTLTECRHFDMGGERWPAQVSRTCDGKKNSLYLSHADHDHVSFISKAHQRWPELCLAVSSPLYHRAPSFHAVKNIKPCEARHVDVRELKYFSKMPVRRRLEPNRYSRVFVLGNSVLVPGDAVKESERHFARHPLPGVTLLIAGHHGSQTSTSAFLLAKLPSLRHVWVSARKRKYGHPHRTVRERVLRKRAVLKETEKWGTLYMPLQSEN